MNSELWHPLLIGFCLTLVMEGVRPLLYAQPWRTLVNQLALLSNRGLRITGFVSMMTGVILLYIFN